MKIGIISDTHDDMGAVKQALNILATRGCGFLIHAGDLCSPFIARLIKDSGIPHAAVFGNNDGDRIALSRVMDITPAPRPLVVEGMRMVVFHEPFINDFVDPSATDLLVYGHTHIKDVTVRNGMTVVNPGTLAGVLAEGRTFALYDSNTKEVEIIEIP